MNKLKIKQLLAIPCLLFVTLQPVVSSHANAGLVNVEPQLEKTITPLLVNAVDDVEVPLIQSSEGVGAGEIKAHRIDDELIESHEYSVQPPVDEAARETPRSSLLARETSPASFNQSNVLDGGQIVKIAASLLAVLALIFLLAKLAQRFGPSNWKGGQSMKVIEALAIAPRERLMLVEIHGLQYLISVGQGGSKLMTSIPKPPQDGWESNDFPITDDESLDELVNQFAKETKLAGDESAFQVTSEDSAMLADEDHLRASFNKTFTVLSGGEHMTGDNGEPGSGRGSRG